MCITFFFTLVGFIFALKSCGNNVIGKVHQASFECNKYR